MYSRTKYFAVADNNIQMDSNGDTPDEYCVTNSQLNANLIIACCDDWDQSKARARTQMIVDDNTRKEDLYTHIVKNRIMDIGTGIAMTEKREVTYIELTWEDNEDLLSLAESEQFTHFILEESLKAIIDALDNDKSTAELFNIFNMSVIIEINKSQFKTVLDKINDMFVKNEEYERCAQLSKLIKKYQL